MSRFWLAVARFAAKRAGDYVVRMYREPTDAQYLSYSESWLFNTHTGTLTPTIATTGVTAPLRIYRDWR